MQEQLTFPMEQPCLHFLFMTTIAVFCYEERIEFIIEVKIKYLQRCS